MYNYDGCTLTTLRPVQRRQQVPLMPPASQPYCGSSPPDSTQVLVNALGEHFLPEWALEADIELEKSNILLLVSLIPTNVTGIAHVMTT